MRKRNWVFAKVKVQNQSKPKAFPIYGLYSFMSDAIEFKYFCYCCLKLFALVSF